MLTSKALLISKENFGEADCYVEFLTETWGVITALAKSARKSRRRYVGGLDLFCHDEISLRGDPHVRPYLEELKVLNTFYGLRESHDKAFTAGRVLQWVHKLVPTSTPVPEVYRLTGQVLTLIETEPLAERLLSIEVLFKLKLISLLGLKPRVDTCGFAENPTCTTQEPYLDLSSGSVICPRCANGRPLLRQNLLTAEQRQFLALGDQIRLSQWSQLELSHSTALHLNKLLIQFTNFHTHVFVP